MAENGKRGDEVVFFVGGNVPEERKSLLGTPNDQATLTLLNTMGFRGGSLKVVEQSGSTQHFILE